jgi:Uncharacterized protein conserved in bacteria (DUF2188)
MKKEMRRKAHHDRGKKTAPRHSRLSAEQSPSLDVTYEVVQHDGGWAYKVNGAFSEAFPTHADALAAAQSAAAEQELPGDAETIESRMIRASGTAKRSAAETARKPRSRTRRSLESCCFLRPVHTS